MSVAVPSTLDDVLARLAATPNALLLQGGTDVMVEINLGRRPPPPTIISLRSVASLRTWRHTPPSTDHHHGTVTIGAGVPYAALEHGELARLVPALAHAARTVGSPQIRAVGTLGGNLATASPAGDSLPVLCAHDAVVHLARHGATRDVSVRAFLIGPKRCAREPSEVITGVTMPVLDGWQGYAKVGVRNAMVIAIASACLAVDRDGGTVRLALGAVGPTVLRCDDTEAWFAARFDVTASPEGGARLDPALATEFGRRAANECRPIDDHRASAEYRRHAIRVLATRLANRAFT